MKSPTEHLADCDTLSASHLREKYPAEANSHRAMLSRRSFGAVVSAGFTRFRDFLRYMGPRPRDGDTLDRVDNVDPEYSPEKIAWRSKKDQSRNRSNVIHLTDADGTKRTLAEWAEFTGQSRYTLHARKRRGMCDRDVIYGPKAHTASSAEYSSQGFPWPEGSDHAAWEEMYARHHRRNETRADFLWRFAVGRQSALLEKLAGEVEPGIDPGPEYAHLTRPIEHWGRVIERATEMVLRAKYGESGMPRHITSRDLLGPDRT